MTFNRMVMKQPVTIPPGLQADELQALVSGFIRFNGMHKMEVKEVTEDKIIVGAVKKTPQHTLYEEKQLKRSLVPAIVNIYQPFVPGKTVHVHITLIQEPRPDRMEMKAKKYALKQIKKKIKEKLPLTRQEELLYLVEVQGHSQTEAEEMIRTSGGLTF